MNRTITPDCVADLHYGDWFVFPERLPRSPIDRSWSRVSVGVSKTPPIAAMLRSKWRSQNQLMRDECPASAISMGRLLSEGNCGSFEIIGLRFHALLTMFYSQQIPESACALNQRLGKTSTDMSASREHTDTLSVDCRQFYEMIMPRCVIRELIKRSHTAPGVCCSRPPVCV